jgi:cysteine-rich repeat protein
VAGLSVAGIACTCGNAKLDANEECDDSNTFSNDGCSSACKIEAGFKCTGTPSICQDGACGDGRVSGFEQCDTEADKIGFFGCNANCTGVIPGFECSTSN